MKKYITSESVTEGHPDKVCDQISDKILDTALSQDKESKMAVECTIKDNLIFIYGESSTKANIPYEKIAKEVIKEIGYNEEYEVITKISTQSKEISKAVNKEKISAGDQGIMFGYATDETKELMPLPILLANKLTEKLSIERKKNKDSVLLPDGKSQVTVEYINNTPKRIDTIIVSSSHKESVSLEELRKYIKEKIITSVIPKKYIDNNTKIMINPAGTFITSGSFADSGTTGRKIVVDSYGGSAKVGGGCFSSKDPSKVDRSGAYYARYVAKNIVHNKLAKRCEVSVSYAIGYDKPIHIGIDTFGTNKVSMEKIYDFVKNNFNFSVDNIIKELNLYNVEYYKVASYGHFGREELNLPWEKTKEFN